MIPSINNTTCSSIICLLLHLELIWSLCYHTASGWAEPLLTTKGNTVKTVNKNVQISTPTVFLLNYIVLSRDRR